ncbi:MAG: hypothetical protein JJE39_10835 [Vicinamibacteria bacterium]|nr:hypothetical protein [Vicinamibacteria bacterium]
MSRLWLLLGLAFRSRLRGFASSGASSVLVVAGGLIYIAFACALGVAAYMALSQSRSLRVDRVADFVALGVTVFGVFFLTRPFILSNLSGSSLQNLLHLPIRRAELLAYSLVTGVVTPLLLESPVLIGAVLGVTSRPSLILLTLPLTLLAHVTLLAGTHSMSLVAVLIARRTWVADVARVLAFSIFFLPSLLNSRGVREFLRPLVHPLANLSPLGWAARATVYAGTGDVRQALWFAVPALLALAGVAFLSMTLLNRILEGEGEDQVDQQSQTPRPARVILPGALGALIETQLRTQLRTPAARMALLMPTLMMGLFALSLSRPGRTPGSAIVMIIFLTLIGGNAFVMVGRGIALILGTPVSRASMLVASDVAATLFRIPPLFAIIAVTAWRSGLPSALTMTALTIALLPVSLGVQHFVSILRPFALPRDRLNPFARRVDGRQQSHGLLSLLATMATALIASPFVLLAWLSSRIAGGAYAPSLLALACLGALATYAVLVVLAERLFLKRELQVMEVLLDDSPG